VSDHGPITVRSYRRVFDLERRWHHRHLPPGGVPLRAVGYGVLVGVGAVILGALPPLALLGVPTLVRFIVAAAIGIALSIARPQGRLVHQVLSGLAHYHFGPRQLVALRPTDPQGGRWTPDGVWLIPDGSEPRWRRLAYRGPGLVAVGVTHRRSESTGGRRHARVAISPHPIRRRLARPSTLSVQPGARLEVRP